MTVFAKWIFAPSPPLDGTHFSWKCLFCSQENKPLSGHAYRMPFDLSELLEQTRPPDPELASLIDQAYLEGQIDGQKADLAYSWLITKNKDLRRVARI